MRLFGSDRLHKHVITMWDSPHPPDLGFAVLAVTSLPHCGPNVSSGRVTEAKVSSVAIGVAVGCTFLALLIVIGIVQFCCNRSCKKCRKRCKRNGTSASLTGLYLSFTWELCHAPKTPALFKRDHLYDNCLPHCLGIVW